VLRSFNSLALRQLRTRPLRSVLTTFGVVLGVGMVFGVLLLVGTIRATFDEVIGSAWGETDLVVMGEGNGTMAEETLDRIKEVEGVREAAGMVGGMFTRLEPDGSPVEGNTGQMLIAGYETEGYQPYDFRLVEGRRIGDGLEIMVEQNWARDRGYDVGDRVGVAGPTGLTELPIIGIFKLTSGLNVGGIGYAAMPLPAARRVFDQPEGWTQISIAATDRGEVGPLKRRVEKIAGRGTNVQTPGEFSDQVSEQLAGLNIVLYFFSGVALFVGGFLILNSFNMTVLQSMRELGMFRTLGASRAMATASVLTEALVIGVAGYGAGARARARAGVRTDLADAWDGRAGRQSRRECERGDHRRGDRHLRDAPRRVLAGPPRRPHLTDSRGRGGRPGAPEGLKAPARRRPCPVHPGSVVRRLVLVRG
jgi:putative ABC transport system permease protein